MKRTYLIVLTCLLLGSCSNKREGETKTTLLSNFISITDRENNGVKEILDFYGGYCEYSIGVALSTAEANTKYFELKLSKSEALDDYLKSPEVVASNMAFIFYNNLKEEKKNYTEIHSVLQFNNGEQFKEIYSKEQLDLIQQKMAVLNKVVEIMKSKDLEPLKDILSNESYNTDSKNDLIKNINNAEATFGNVKGFQLYGFQQGTINDFNILKILGVIERDKKNHEFSLNVDLKVSEDLVHYLDFKWGI